MQNSKIEWTDHTANLWIGCEEIHDGCLNCYARVSDNRWGHKNWGNDVPRRAVKKVWGDFVRWQKEAAAAGRIDRVFVGSMMDIFEKNMPLQNPIELNGVKINDTHTLRYLFLKSIWAMPNLMFLLLTKRPGNIGKMIPAEWEHNMPANVMFGCSISDQVTANAFIPKLLRVPGKRFLSIEPQLGNIDINAARGPFNGYWQWGRECSSCTGKGHYADNFDTKCSTCYGTGNNSFGIDWVIVGGESGNKKRAYNADWARYILYQCREAKVPFFMKQIDKVQSIPDDLMIMFGQGPINKKAPAMGQGCCGTTCN